MATQQDISAFQAMFPELQAVPPARVSVSLDMADVFLDASMWDTNDFPLARYLWSAAWTALQAQAMAGSPDGTGVSDLYTASVKFSDRSVTYQQRAYTRRELEGSAGDALLERTIYGIRFLQLRDRNIIPIMVI